MATKLEKYIWLVDTLRRSGGLTLEEICRAWERSGVNDAGTELTVRSFRRYCREIEDRFGIRIRCDRRDYTYQVEEDTAGEGGVQSWLLDTLAVDNLIKESRELRGRILFERIPSGQQYLARIIGAMRDGIVLEMKYARFSDEEPYSTWLHPYFVKVFAQRWYVVGPTGRHPRTPHVYALDRVLALKETPDRFDYPAGFDPEAFFADSYGIFRGDSPAEKIVLRAGERQAKYLRSLPLHASQIELSVPEAASLGYDSDSGAVFVLRLAPTLDFIQYLLSQGDELEVLAPESLRADIARRAAAIADLYR